MDRKEIEDLIQLFERSSLSELVLERGETKLVLRRQFEGAPPSRPPAETPSFTRAKGEERPEGAAEPAADHGYLVRSPIVGTFYRRPSPEEDPYVEVGDRVDVGDTVCIVEAMKVMNEVRTERAGRIKEILVEDATAVEYGEPLIVVDSQEG